MDSRTKLSADVSFGVPNASESVVLTQAFLKRFPQALPMIVVLKTLLRQNQLNLVHRGGLSSYAVTLLVVSYLKLREHEVAQKRMTAGGRTATFATGGPPKPAGLALHAEAVAILEQIEDGDTVDVVDDPLDPYNVGCGSFTLHLVGKLIYLLIISFAPHLVLPGGVLSGFCSTSQPRTCRISSLLLLGSVQFFGCTPWLGVQQSCKTLWISRTTSSEAASTSTGCRSCGGSPCTPLARMSQD